MNMSPLLIVLLPTLGGGLMPIVAKKINGNSYETMLGTTLFVVCIMSLSIILKDLSYTFSAFMICFFSGIFWGIGQWLQFESFSYIAVSNAMPISNGSQLLFTSLASWILLNDWPGWQAGLFSLFSLGMVILGIIIINKDKQTSQEGQRTKAIGFILMSSVFLTFYVSITSIFNISGSMVFFPQAIGMLTVSSLMIILKKEVVIQPGVVIKNGLTGFLWLIANVSIFYSSQRIGLGLAYSISQLCVIVSIVGGIFLLGEKKDKKETYNLGIGSVLMIVGILFLGLAK